jgi:hypothetical protein
VRQLSESKFPEIFSWISATEQRQVLRGVGSVGTGQRPGVAGKSHECAKPALAEEKRGQKEWRFRVGWSANSGVGFLTDVRGFCRPHIQG